MQQQVVGASDMFGLLLALSFGVWWILFPSSVINFYTWFHRGKVALPRPIGVRLVGGLWVVVVVVVAWVNLRL